MAVNLASTTCVNSQILVEVWWHTLLVCLANVEIRDRTTKSMLYSGIRFSASSTSMHMCNIIRWGIHAFQHLLHMFVRCAVFIMNHKGSFFCIYWQLTLVIWYLLGESFSYVITNRTQLILIILYSFWVTPYPCHLGRHTWTPLHRYCAVGRDRRKGRCRKKSKWSSQAFSKIMS